MAVAEQPASPLVPPPGGVHFFGFDGAPCSRRTRFALAEKGLTRRYVHRADDIWSIKVMRKNRLFHYGFRMKAFVENLVGRGIRDAGRPAVAGRVTQHHQE